MNEKETRDLFKFAAELVDRREDFISRESDKALSQGLDGSKRRIERKIKGRLNSLENEDLEEPEIKFKLDRVIHGGGSHVFSIIWLVDIGGDVPLVVRSDSYPSTEFDEMGGMDYLLANCPHCGAHSWVPFGDDWPEVVIRGAPCERCKAIKARWHEATEAKE